MQPSPPPSRPSREPAAADPTPDRYRVGILGATGWVGQRLIQRLSGHPWFEVVAVGASPRSVGKSYREATRWQLSSDPPPEVTDLEVVPCDVGAMGECDLVLSGLDSTLGRELEPTFADAGMAVISNSSAYRQHPDVPLLIPEVNASHVALLDRQAHRAPGFIVTNPNCSVTGLAVALAPLQRTFGIRKAIVTTMQALSGAGMSGPRAVEFVDNVVPFISGEEDKIELELSKLFGRVDTGELERAEVLVSAHCHRVATLDGHLEAVSLELDGDPSPEQVVDVLRAFEGEAADLELPSRAQPLIVVRDEPDRPQPRLDRDAGDGMAVTVGRVRRCPVLGMKLVLLSHNTLRGAAAGTVLNAELLVARGRVPRRSRA